MDIQFLLISTGVGILAGAISAYITTLFKLRQQKKEWEYKIHQQENEWEHKTRQQYQQLQHDLLKLEENWKNEMVMKLIEAQAIDPIKAQNISKQHGMAVLIIQRGKERDKKWIMRHQRLSVGRDINNEIKIDDLVLSKTHCSFSADNEGVFIEPLGARNPVYLNKKIINKKTKLKDGDVIDFGSESNIMLIIP